MPVAQNNGESSGSSTSESSGEESNEEEELYFACAHDRELCAREPVELDTIRKRCTALRHLLRRRPTLPTKANGECMSKEDLNAGVRLPLYSCPFKGKDGTACRFHTDDRTAFLHHIAGGVSDATHKAEIEKICGHDMPWLTALDYVQAAVAIAERENWPRLGLSTTRRALNQVALRYNDEKIQCLTCFVCCQLRTTCEGYPVVNLNSAAGTALTKNSEIQYRSQAAFCEMESKHPGTLLNNCSYDLWRRRYRKPGPQGKSESPWSLTEPLEKPLRECVDNRDRHISQWAVGMEYKNHHCTLFGCCEDIRCSQEAKHAAELEQAPFHRTLCSGCEVPVCSACWLLLAKHDAESIARDGGTIPMSLSNDHYYGHVNKYIVDNNVTWLECAASCMIWSTMLVYYLESPYGHLMDVALGKPQGRTHVKGNLFSFNMPWEDIERCCHQAILHAKQPHTEALSKLQSELGLPHSEETLALLVNVHIVGGNKDLALHLKGLTMRVKVLQDLIEILRHSGYPGYEQDGVNSPALVAQRLDERYTQKYGHASFTPQAIQNAVRLQQKQQISIVQEKSATPAEAPKDVAEWDKTLRPHHIVAERSVRSQSNVQENYASVFSQFGDLKIETGATMIDQHNAWFLGMAFPFTIPTAVGSHDVPHKPRWRRPEDEDIIYPRECLDSWMTSRTRSAQAKLPIAHAAVGTACEVKLFDITRGLPQRVEGQYRRHWSFTPALWNLYFRERLNLGVGLSVKRNLADASSGQEVETDAALAAADLLQKLEKGFYIDNGKRRRINGDASKLLFAEKLSQLQRRLLSDFRFRCKALPGTQEMRTKIGHVGFWAGVNYGNGIFCTISPGERHNYLSLKLSRYRAHDPFVAHMVYVGCLWKLSLIHI